MDELVYTYLETRNDEYKKASTFHYNKQFKTLTQNAIVEQVVNIAKSKVSIEESNI